MKKTAVILSILSLLLNSCNQNKPTANIPVVGEAIDSSAIAQDTLQQKIMDGSYEYAQTVIISPKLVYDVRAYGGPASHGEYCIIRRGADNKPDTVVQKERVGAIINAFTGDLNNNGKEEIYVVLRKPNSKTASYISAFEFDKNGRATAITASSSPELNITLNDQPHNDSLYPKGDTIFLKGNLLIKGSLPFKSKEEIAYRLKGTSLIINLND